MAAMPRHRKPIPRNVADRVFSCAGDDTRTEFVGGPYSKFIAHRASSPRDRSLPTKFNSHARAASSWLLPRPVGVGSLALLERHGLDPRDDGRLTAPERGPAAHDE